MFDMTFGFDPVALAVDAFHLGWPGLLIGAALGLWGWSDRRSFGGVIGALLGVCLWASMRLVFF